MTACVKENDDSAALPFDLLNGDPEDETDIEDEDEDEDEGDGCIKVNGSGGYSTINAALDASEDGDVIALCGEEYNERVIITKAVTIKGPTSGEPAIISSTSEDQTVSIRSDNVEISRVTINSNGNGIYIRDVDSVSLRVVSFGTVGNTAIRANGSTNVLIQASDFLNLEHGVVHLDEGGSLRIVNCYFDGIPGYATRVRTGATLSLEGNEFYNGVEDTDGRNAAARASDDAYLYSTSNVYTANPGAVILASDSLVQSIGDEFTGGTHAISSSDGPVVVEDATITHPLMTGIRAYSTTGDVTVTNTTITADPATNAFAEAESWSNGKADEGVGIYAAAPGMITLSDVSISGFNHGGIYLARGGTDDVIAELTNISLDNIGWHGLYIQESEATLTEVTVTNLRVSDAVGDTLCTKVGEYGGATFRSATVDWQGGEISKGSGLGIAGLQSNMAFSGVTIQENVCAGIMNYEGSLTVDDSDFSAPSPHELGASIVNWQASESSLTNSRFVDSGSIAAYATAESGEYTYISYQRMGGDFQAWYGGTHTVDGNTFTTGARGVYGNDVDLVVNNNTWSDYSQYGALVVDGSITFDDNEFTSSSGHLLACIRGTVNSNNSNARDTVVGTDRSTETYSMDGTLLSTTPENYAYPALYSEACDTTLSGLAFVDTVALAALFKGGTHTLSDTTVLRPNTAYYSNSAIEFYDSWTRTTESGFEFYVDDTQATLTDVDISETGFGGAIKHIGEPDEATGVTSSLHLINVNLSDLGSDGLEAQNVHLIAERTSINAASGRGVVVEGGTLTFTEGTVDQSTGYGFMLTNTDATLERSISQNNTYDGVYASGGSLVATENTIKLNQNHGIQLNGVTATLSNNNITDNVGYGLICGSSTFLACDNTFLGNGFGPTDSCDSDCFGDLIIDDTGDTDSGMSATDDSGSADTGDLDTVAPDTPGDTGVEDDSDTGDAALSDVAKMP